MPNTRIFVLLSMLAVTGAEARSYTYDTWVEDYTAQALLGAVRYDNLKFNVSDSASPTEANLSTIPQLGGVWSTLPVGERFQLGLESSLLIGVRVDKLNYLRAGGGGLHISLSTTLWTFDFAGGAYANLYLDPAKNIRLYAGGGPLMMYASYRSDREFSDNSDDEVYTDSAFGLGVYARTGIEFRIEDAGMLGFGVRGTWADIDFSDVGGRSDLKGLGIFATFTAGF